ncbi:MAG TPA: hypothetical protein VHW64_17790 [Nocardioides sp.]|uniref:hypothetical protein n=1 Tax=Nocardioides sp. TaxID=35761 RepID=UPI002E346043|nr:hypothetical protein [Nocardioides sp.]HEX3932552.1 hypothetical protein [Nocardioides sp.]
MMEINLMHASSPRHPLARSRVLAASVLAVTLSVLGASTASSSASADPSAHSMASERSAKQVHKKKVRKVKVARTLFGVHDRYLTSLTHSSTGSIRLWDAGTTWPDIEPTQGTFDWQPLDDAVTAAHANHTQVTLVLGVSPSYAAASTIDAPNIAMYKAYLKAVMQRYSAKNWGYRGIAAYQVWNEVNIKTFWSGTTAQLDDLTKAAYDVRNQVDKGALLVAPAMVTRLGFEQKGIGTFYSSKVSSTHKPVWRYVDAISLNLYPPQTVALKGGGTRFSTPEDTMVLLKTVRRLLAKAKVPSSLPIWNTEVNYGIGSGVAATPISDSRQVANVIRTYLLNAAAGVKRVDWYAWDMGQLPGGGTLGNTLLTDPADRAGGVLTPAGRAFARVESWMKGTLIGTRTKQPCIADRNGTYTCEVKYRHGVGRVYWNPYRSAKVKLVHSARTKVDELGTSSKAKGGSKLKVSYEPVLVKSSK